MQSILSRLLCSGQIHKIAKDACCWTCTCTFDTWYNETFPINLCIQVPSGKCCLGWLCLSHMSETEYSYFDAASPNFQNQQQPCGLGWRLPQCLGLQLAGPQYISSSCGGVWWCISHASWTWWTGPSHPRFYYVELYFPFKLHPPIYLKKGLCVEENVINTEPAQGVLDCIVWYANWFIIVHSMQYCIWTPNVLLCINPLLHQTLPTMSLPSIA